MKTVLFDLDDTLYDYTGANEPAEFAMYKEITKMYGELELKEFKKRYKLAKEEIKRELVGTASSHNRILYIQRFMEKWHEEFWPKDILTLYNAYWDTLLSVMKPLDGMVDLLKTLHGKGYNIGVVTNLTAQIQIRKIMALGISDYVDLLVTSEETGTEKPHSGMFLVAAKKFNVLPSDCFFAGDSLNSDIEGANSVGMTTIRVLWGSHSVDESDGETQVPNYSVESLSEILDIVG